MAHTPGNTGSKTPAQDATNRLKLSFTNKTPGQKVGSAVQKGVLNLGPRSWVGASLAGRGLPSQMDRFIPTRSGLDVDMANMHLTKENQTDNGDGQGSPTAGEYQAMLAGQLGVEREARILAFKQKAPAPPEGHDNSLRGLYTENLAPAPSKKQFRQAPVPPITAAESRNCALLKPVKHRRRQSLRWVSRVLRAPSCRSQAHPPDARTHPRRSRPCRRLLPQPARLELPKLGGWGHDRQSVQCA